MGLEDLLCWEESAFLVMEAFAAFVKILVKEAFAAFVKILVKEAFAAFVVRRVKEAALEVAVDLKIVCQSPA